MIDDERFRAGEYSRKMRTALREWERWSVEWPQLADKIERSRTSWLLPHLSDSVAATFSLPALPPAFSVAATDGSQIFPDRHDISSCYLINIGYVLLHYGLNERPLLNSRPKLFYKADDLYSNWGGRKVVASRETVAHKRTVLEFTELSDLALAAAAEGFDPMAAADGTLILWNLEGKPQNVRSAVLTTVLDSWERLRSKRIPLAGYISQPGSQELINAFRVGLCPLDAADCRRCPWQQSASEIPCQPVEGLHDVALARQFLRVGERTSIFGSSSKILGEYGDHRIHFFYLNVGKEVARVEVPHWVARDNQMLNTVHSVFCDQAQKGDGYPVALAEAHEQAVVRGRDREMFYASLRQHLITHDVGVKVSNKALRKRVARV